jgi:pimeloyl-ACP methyl ester carboxylesterase
MPSPPEIAARHPPVGRRVEAGAGRRLHLAAEGPEADAPPVILLHGASGNLLDWRLGFHQRLAAMGMRAIAVDRPGFGHSDPPPEPAHTLAAQREGVRAGLAALGLPGPRGLVLLGHSWSGALALDWALAHPGEVAGAMVLAGATMDWGGALDAHYRLAEVPGLGHAIAAAVPHLVGAARLRAALESIFAPDPVPEGYAERAAVALALRPATFRLNARALAALHGQVVANQPRYGAVACPVEVVHGAADRVVPASIHAVPLAERLPDARLTLLDGVGHMPHHAAPERVAELVARLRRRTG